MYYFQSLDSEILKFKVNIDIAKLTYIYNQLIDNCSIIEDVIETKKELKNIESTSNYYVRSFKYTKLDSDKYKLTYKKYYKCDLAYIIEKIFRKDINGVYELFNYNPLTTEELFNNKIMLLSNKIDEIDNSNTKEKKKMLTKMEDLLKLVNNNKTREDEINYLDKVKSLIDFEYINRINKEDLNNMNSFFEYTLNIMEFKDINTDKPTKARRL